MRRRHQRQVKHSLSLRERQGKSLPDVTIVQRYGINPLVHRLGEIVEGSQLSNRCDNAEFLVMRFVVRRVTATCI